MDLLVEKFDKMIEEKNKEIEIKFLLKQKKTNKDIKQDKDISEHISNEIIEEADDTINNIDYNTKKTLYKINAEIDRKYKSSKAYKKTIAYSI